MSGRINLDNISDDFKSYLQGLGLTEEQVNEAITVAVGNKNNLQTENKDSLVDAINEVFQRGDNVKNKLVDKLISEGSDVSTNNTFDELINKIALGKKYATGECNLTGGTVNGYSININVNLDFTPTVVFVLCDFYASRSSYMFVNLPNILVSNVSIINSSWSYTSAAKDSGDIKITQMDNEYIKISVGPAITLKAKKWFAIG